MHEPAGRVFADEERPEAVFFTMANSAPVLLWMAGTDGLCSFFNETWLRFTGRSLEQERGFGWAEGVHPEDFEQCVDTYMAAFRARESFEMVYRLRRHDGDYRWILDRGTPRYADDGRFTGYIGSCADITEARQQRDRLRQVVESSPSAILLLTAEGRIVMVNAQAERVFGYAREELLEQPVERLVADGAGTPAPFSAHLAEQARTLPPGTAWELRLRRRGAADFPAELAVSSFDSGEGPMLLAAVADVSERHERIARIEAALREKDLMLGEIHHRVKNNLQIIHSLLDMQSRRVTDRAAGEALEASRNRVQSMSLIHQTLYQSQDFEHVDLGTFLDRLLPMLTALAGPGATAIRLEVDTEQMQLPIGVAIPCGLLVNELVSNALKHAFPHGRGGTVQLRLSRPAPGRAKLVVGDDGVPLPDSVDLAGTSTLGLRLVGLLAHQIGGSVGIERGVPKRFVVEFPLKES